MNKDSNKPWEKIAQEDQKAITQYVKQHEKYANEIEDRLNKIANLTVSKKIRGSYKPVRIKIHGRVE